MREDQPTIPPPEDEPVEVPSEAREPLPGPRTAGKEIAEPEVPLVEGFDPAKVTKVVRYPEDRSERQKVRSDTNKRTAKIALENASISRPASSTGRKGRASWLDDK